MIAHDAREILDRACQIESQMVAECLQSSFDDGLPTIDPSPNGFVHGAIRAYNRHHHLRIRPEDGKQPLTSCSSSNSIVFASNH